MCQVGAVIADHPMMSYLYCSVPHSCCSHDPPACCKADYDDDDECYIRIRPERDRDQYQAVVDQPTSSSTFDDHRSSTRTTISAVSTISDQITIASEAVSARIRPDPSYMTLDVSHVPLVDLNPSPYEDSPDVVIPRVETTLSSTPRPSVFEKTESPPTLIRRRSKSVEDVDHYHEITNAKRNRRTTVGFVSWCSSPSAASDDPIYDFPNERKSNSFPRAQKVGPSHSFFGLSLNSFGLQAHCTC